MVRSSGVRRKKSLVMQHSTLQLKKQRKTQDVSYRVVGRFSCLSPANAEVERKKKPK